MKKIYIVDDHKEICDLLEKVFRKENFDAVAFYHVNSLIEALKEDCPDIVLLDVQMPDIDGLEALKIIKTMHPKLKVVIMTAYAEKQKSKFFLENGAIDFISKPFKLKDIRVVISKVLSEKNLLDRKFFEEKVDLIGESEKIKKCVDKALKLSNSDAPILILGESGTGKEGIVDFIHYNSVRKHSKLVKINCAAIPVELLESELFGYEKGAFTGASTVKLGKIEEAHEGTLFLDEIGEMDIKLQTKLLRVLEYKNFERLGGNKQIYSDFRIICATNRDIMKQVDNNDFREDLFYRINTFNIKLPPLRERREDIPLLVKHFIELFREEYVTSVKKISKDALKALEEYHWPGNIRELKNVVQRMISIASEEEITLEDVPSNVLMNKKGQTITENQLLSIEEIEKQHIIKVLKKVNGNKKEAINILDISEKTLYNKIQKYSIEL